MKGSGCFNCPVKNCETMNYRGSTCAAQRAKFGLGDPMTNADRIRAMTDEELAALLAHETYRIAEPYFQYCGFGITEELCCAMRLKWLQQSVEG